MAKKLLLNLILLTCFSYGFAQQTFSITGLIKDQKETLPGAAVYVSGYKISTVTNNDGKFVLANLKPGSYDILVQMIGYLPASKNVVIADKSVNIEIILTENATLLKEIVVRPDQNREVYINLFKDYFIGKSPNAKQCKILNTDVLVIDDDKANRVLTIKATDFLIIENLALGYRIKYLLELLEYDYNSKIIFYSGYPTFEEMKGSKAKQKKWAKNREIAYNGSNEHFFKALYDNKVTEEGFVIYKRIEIANKNRLPDSLINAKIKQLTMGQNAVGNLIRYNGGNDSLSYWMKQKREPKKLNILNRAPVLVDTLVKKYNDALKLVSYTDELYVIYKNERETAEYDFSGHKQIRPLDIGNFQISAIKMLDQPVHFYANGAVANPRSLLYSGYWSYEKMADSVPMDYVYTLKKP